MPSGLIRFLFFFWHGWIQNGFVLYIFCQSMIQFDFIVVIWVAAYLWYLVKVTINTGRGSPEQLKTSDTLLHVEGSQFSMKQLGHKRKNNSAVNTAWVHFSSHVHQFWWAGSLTLKCPCKDKWHHFCMTIIGCIEFFFYDQHAKSSQREPVQWGVEIISVSKLFHLHTLLLHALQ